MKTTTYKCDIEKCSNEAIHKEFKIQVIFLTEQTEGRSCSPYLSSNLTLDLCKDCKSTVLRGNYISAAGAQGYNQYYLSDSQKKLEHHKDTTVGLWATDRPDLVEDPKKIMFQIEYT